MRHQDAAAAATAVGNAASFPNDSGMRYTPAKIPSITCGRMHIGAIRGSDAVLTKQAAATRDGYSFPWEMHPVSISTIITPC